MTALTPRIVELSIGSKKLGNVNIENPLRNIQYKRSGIMLPPGETVLSFDTDTNPVSPHHGDARKLSFQISDFNFAPDGN